MQETVEKIRISADNARMMLNMGKELVEKAKRFLEEARKAYMVKIYYYISVL